MVILDNLDSLLDDPDIIELMHNQNVGGRKRDGVSSNARKLLPETNSQFKPVMRKIQTVLNSANKALDGPTKTPVSVDGFAGELSGTRHKLNRTLDEIAAVAKSLKSPMDYPE